MELRRLYRSLLAGAVISAFMVVSMTGAILSAPLRRRFQARNVCWFSRLFLFVMEIQVRRIERGSGRRRLGTLIVSNHLSYLDAIVLAARDPVIFITSVEVRDSAFLGHLAKLGGCAFVERRNRAGIDGEISEIARLLADGFNVVLFPEGTSTNGSQVLPFKRSLFRTVLGTKAPVLPVTLNYLSVGGCPVSASNRDQIFYYGDLEFSKQFSDFLGAGKIQVEVRESDSLISVPDHRILAARAQERIVRSFIPVR